MTPVIIEDLGAERLFQNMKFTGSFSGIQRHNIVTWALVLAEESGEAAKAALDLIYKPGPNRMAELRSELVQTAAVAIAIIERIDDSDPSLTEPETYESQHA